MNKQKIQELIKIIIIIIKGVHKDMILIAILGINNKEDFIKIKIINIIGKIHDGNEPNGKIINGRIHSGKNNKIIIGHITKIHMMLFNNLEDNINK